MKRILTALLAGVMTLGLMVTLAGCGKDADVAPEATPIASEEMVSGEPSSEEPAN